MKKSYSLQTKLSVILVSAFMAVVVMIGVTANYFINKEFVKFITAKEEAVFEQTKDEIAEQYNVRTGRWDRHSLRSISNKALEEGHVVKILDTNGEVVFDVESHSMSNCKSKMHEIRERMKKFDKNGNGEFVSDEYPLEYNGERYGTLIMKHYKPFFLSESEFDYLTTLNRIMLVIGGLSLVLAVLLGRYLAYKISNPIKKSIDATHNIANGNYDVVEIDTSNTIELENLFESISLLSNTLSQEELARQELTANLAHELRTPLTTLSTYVETMMLGVWEVTPERLEELYNEINRLSSMVEDLEAIGKSDNRMLNLNLSNINIESLINQCIEMLSQEAKNKSIEINLEISSVSVEVDELRMYQVIYNIIHNAIKYSQPNSKIEVYLYEKDKQAIIEVKDHGIGISEKEIPLIFERLYRSEKSRNRATGGSGIGLSIAKSIVEAHSGTITVRSDGRTYSIFKIKLPKN